MRLNVGDRVSRFIETGKAERRHGVIVEVTLTQWSYAYPQTKQYTVKWDDGETTKFHVENSLQKEPPRNEDQIKEWIKPHKDKGVKP